MKIYNKLVITPKLQHVLTYILYTNYKIIVVCKDVIEEVLIIKKNNLNTRMKKKTKKDKQRNKKKQKKKTHVSKYWHECEPIGLLLIIVFHDATRE